MARQKIPATPAIRALRRAEVSFIPRPYRYQEGGGTRVAAVELKVDEHLTIKTLVMEDESKSPLVILMHGDKEVSTKTLARLVGVKQITPCDAPTAFKHTGYQVGGISPFGLRRALPIFIEASILDLEMIYINGGKRGLLVEMSPPDLVRLLKPRPINVAR